MIKGTVNGLISVVQGGKFGHGFLSTFASTAGAPTFVSGAGAGAVVARTVYASTVGGTISLATGGKFGNGATTSAFAHLFNFETEWEAKDYDHDSLNSMISHSPVDMEHAHLVEGDPALRVGGGQFKASRANSLKAHTGIDIQTKYGAPVYAVADGILRINPNSNTYGIGVYLDLDSRTNGFALNSGKVVVYGHMSGLAVNISDGVLVQAGQLIGYVGTAGNVPAGGPPHLHLEVRIDGKYVNPQNLDKLKVSYPKRE